MVDNRWWVVLAALAQCLAQAPELTVCHDESCHCDSFTRVICNCTRDYDEVTLRPNGAYRVPPTATGIIIDGCARVYFFEDTVSNLIRLRTVELKNIRHIDIDARGLHWDPFPNSDLNPGIRITIHNSTINKISSHAIQGLVDEIVISNSRINAIDSFAFSNLKGVRTIELTDNVYGNIGSQSFKKFTTLNFLLRGGFAKTLPSRFLTDVEVINLFRMDGMTVNYMYSVTFYVISPKRVLIESNKIETLEGDAFHITTRGPITFRNNTVETVRRGAFFGFSAEVEVTSVLGRQELLLDNNTLSEVSPASLMYNASSLTLRVDGLNLRRECDCDLAVEWHDMLQEQGGTINCWYVLENHYVSLPTYVDTRCGDFKQNFWIFILVGLVVVILVAAAVTFYIVKRENEKKKKLQIVMPDGKTYRETEFHIVVERAELLTTDL